mmetsp:Transcript_9975/g.27154  ORF Transcript_9975/g.27154 Transcript_9975/m.27154 type:complete len:135 (-) Transcript_9975:44-448(-)
MSYCPGPGLSMMLEGRYAEDPGTSNGSLKLSLEMRCKFERNGTPALAELVFAEWVIELSLAGRRRLYAPGPGVMDFVFQRVRGGRFCNSTAAPVLVTTASPHRGSSLMPGPGPSPDSQKASSVRWLREVVSSTI